MSLGGDKMPFFPLFNFGALILYANSQRAGQDINSTLLSSLLSRLSWQGKQLCLQEKNYKNTTNNKKHKQIYNSKKKTF